MKKISSAYSVRLPMIGAVLALVGIVAAMVAAVANARGPIEPAMFLPLIVVPIVGFVLYKIFHDLADEVWDAGDALVVKADSRQVRIPLSEIINVSYCAMMNPPKVTLVLRNPTLFGREVSFVVKRPALSFNFSMRNAIIDDLIQRIDLARRKG
jgi:hypothetical protein